MNPLQMTLSRLGAQDVKIVPEKPATFTLPGDKKPGLGRATISQRAAAVTIWHMGRRSGLGLGEPWSEKHVNTPGGGCAGYSVPFESVSRVQPFEVREKREPMPPMSQSDIEMAAIGDLRVRGFEFREKTTTLTKSGHKMYRLDDESGKSPAVRLVIHEGFAQVFSHRGSLELTAPWRPGETTKAGYDCWIASGSDFSGRSIKESLAVARALLGIFKPMQEAGETKAAEQVEAWLEKGKRVPADHRHLTKANASIDAPGFVAVPEGEKYAGAIVAPMFKPGQEPGALRLSGAQLLLTGSGNIGTDKMMLSGSESAGAFLTIPPPEKIEGQYSLAPWLAKSVEPDEPVIVCEGVATGLALYEAGYEQVVVAYSANNIKDVARYLRNSLPGREIVIATDHDIALSERGGLKSQAVPKAIEAARDVAGKVALPGADMPVGSDARDIIGRKDIEGVRDYIRSALDADAVQEVFTGRVNAREARQNIRAAQVER